MSRLRSVLGAARITHSDGGYTLHADWLDLAAASELESEADRRLHENEPAPALAILIMRPRSEPCPVMRPRVAGSQTGQAKSRVPGPPPASKSQDLPG